MTRPWGLILLVGAQALCALFFVSDILMTVAGLRSEPVTWQTRELLEIGAALGLVLGAVLGAVAYSRTRDRQRRAETALRAARGAFHEVLLERFEAWGLTPAEHDVALFVLKGLTTPEIAALRDTSEGTVKAQTAAVFRKAGVNGRPALMSLFLEDMMAGVEEAAARAT